MNLADVTQIFLGEDEVIQITDSQGHTMWQKQEPTPTGPDYFYIQNETSTAGTITVSGNGRGFSATLSYSTDGTTWTAVNTTSDTIPIAANGKVYLKGTFSINSDTYQYTYSCSVPYSIGGNLLSTVDETNFESATSVGYYTLMFRFEGDTNLTDASSCNLGVATTAGARSLSGLFNGCTSLTTGMHIESVTTPYGGEYYDSFEGMYMNCSALTSAYAPSITGTWTDTTAWLSGVSASGTVYCASQSVQSAIPTNSVNGVPSGWTTALIQ